MKRIVGVDYENEKVKENLKKAKHEREIKLTLNEEE